MAAMLSSVAVARPVCRLSARAGMAGSKLPVAKPVRAARVAAAPVSASLKAETVQARARRWRTRLIGGVPARDMQPSLSLLALCAGEPVRGAGGHAGQL